MIVVTQTVVRTTAVPKGLQRVEGGISYRRSRVFWGGYFCCDSRIQALRRKQEKQRSDDQQGTLQKLWERGLTTPMIPCRPREADMNPNAAKLVGFVQLGSSRSLSTQTNPIQSIPPTSPDYQPGRSSARPLFPGGHTRQSRSPHSNTHKAPQLRVKTPVPS